MAKSQNKESYNKIFTKLKEHHKWFENSIPLIASENIPSPAVREAVISDFGNRYAEGWPGERVYAGCIYIDEVEFECMKLAKKLYKAKFADVRPISKSCRIFCLFESRRCYVSPIYSSWRSYLTW
ncbi:Serine hydroxymethyltransferase protein [Marine Group I thaumarchaeote SCGC RSA3]|uniref:Serine hydroxymethyltransferase protein n=1 Tax=Marine Group I thaumarchaeote SCGC RSA3 TaxID=1503183 RepID=A0A087RQT0_9ARCH|nr:Serine hydroxymethyltransferase protein [Marine Group I thaumarchaeote SCGC RSA3]